MSPSTRGGHRTVRSSRAGDAFCENVASREAAPDILLAIKKGEKVPEIVYTGVDLVTKNDAAELLK